MTQRNRPNTHWRATDEHITIIILNCFSAEKLDANQILTLFNKMINTNEYQQKVNPIWDTFWLQNRRENKSGQGRQNSFKCKFLKYFMKTLSS